MAPLKITVEWAARSNLPEARVDMVGGVGASER